MGKGTSYAAPLSKAYLMSFLSQRLEDNFDGSTRENLRHVILCHEDSELDEKSSQSDEDRTMFETAGHVVIAEAPPRDNIPRYILTRPYSRDSDDELKKIIQVKKPLARIPTCAIFHKLTTGRGVPHSFASEFSGAFIRSGNF